MTSAHSLLAPEVKEENKIVSDHYLLGDASPLSLNSEQGAARSRRPMAVRVEDESKFTEKVSGRRRVARDMDSVFTELFRYGGRSTVRPVRETPSYHIWHTTYEGVLWVVKYCKYLQPPSRGSCDWDVRIATPLIVHCTETPRQRFKHVLDPCSGLSDPHVLELAGWYVNHDNEMYVASDLTFRRDVNVLFALQISCVTVVLQREHKGFSDDPPALASQTSEPSERVPLLTNPLVI